MTFANVRQHRLKPACIERGVCASSGDIGDGLHPSDVACALRENYVYECQAISTKAFEHKIWCWETKTTSVTFCMLKHCMCALVERHQSFHVHINQ